MGKLEGSFLAFFDFRGLRAVRDYLTVKVRGMVWYGMVWYSIVVGGAWLYA
jgi:hypothetical protein